MRLNLLLRGFLLIATLAGTGWLFKATGLEVTTWLDTAVKSGGITGKMLFIAVGALVTALGLPRQMVCFLGGYVCGFIEGSLLALFASVGGCIGSFVYARLLGRAVVLACFPDRICRIDAFLQSHSFATTLLVRLLPIGSNLLTNLAAGISGIRIRAFVTASTLGYIPQTVIFALLGSGMQIDIAFRVSLGVVLFLLSTLLGMWWFFHCYGIQNTGHRHKQRRSLSGE